MQRKILIVEDDPAVRLDAVTALKGFVEADTTPDVILLGLSSGGFEALASVQERHPGVPVVVLTAWADAGLITKLLDRGAAAAVARPLEPAELGLAVAVALEGQADIDESGPVVVAELDPELPEAILAAAGRRLAQHAPVARRGQATFVAATDCADVLHRALTERPVDTAAACRRITATLSVHEPAVALAA